MSRNLEQIEKALSIYSVDPVLLEDKTTSSAQSDLEIKNLQDQRIETTDLIKSFKDLDEAPIHRSNSYYARYATEYSVENLAWSAPNN